MNINDIINADRIIVNSNISSKKCALEYAGELISHSINSLSKKEIVSALLAREKLGSTGIGHGFAIPHARLSSLDQPIASFIRFNTSIDYQSLDGSKVDMLFAFIVPEEQTQCHLDIIAYLSKRFSKAEFRQEIRAAETSTEIYKQLTEALVTHG